MNMPRVATTIIGLLLKESLRYPERLVLEAMILSTRFGVLMLLYANVFALLGGTIAGLSFPDAAWSMFFYFSLMTLGLRGIARMISEDVRSGQVETMLTKPIHYLLLRVWWQIGLSVYPFLVMTTVGSLLLAVTVGLPTVFWTPYFLPTLLLAYIFGIALTLPLYIMVGLTSFWIEDADPVFWIVDKAIMMLGGSYIPVALFPPVLYAIAIYSPFGASQFLTHTVYPTWETSWPMMLGIQAAWIGLATLLCALQFSRAKSRVFVNGG